MPCKVELRRVEAAPMADADGMVVDESDSSVSSASPEVTEGEEDRREQH